MEHDSIRVRICPNLSRNHLIWPENIIYVEQDGIWSEAAYATHLQLENVTPVIHQEKRQAIVNDARNHRDYSGWLEGDLIGWKGRYQADANEATKQLVSPKEKSSRLLFEKAYKPTTQTDVSYNPRRYGCFYADNGGRTSDQALKSAKSLTAIHWYYGAEDAEFRPIKREEKEDYRRPKTGFEEKELARGIENTQKALEKLDPARQRHRYS